MPTQLEYVQAQVMQLTPTERNQLLERLITSLDTDPAIEAEWEQLADQREADIAAGRSQWIPFEEAIAQLRARSITPCMPEPGKMWPMQSIFIRTPAART